MNALLKNVVRQIEMNQHTFKIFIMKISDQDTFLSILPPSHPHRGVGAQSSPLSTSSYPSLPSSPEFFFLLLENLAPKTMMATINNQNKVSDTVVVTSKNIHIRFYQAFLIAFQSLQSVLYLPRNATYLYCPSNRSSTCFLHI